MSFIERVLELIEDNNISKNKMLTDLKLSKNSFVNWNERGTIPSGDTIVKIAKYFNVSVDYLLGLSDKKHRLISFDEIDTIKPSYRDEIFELNFAIAGSETDPELKTLREFMDSHNIQYEVSANEKTTPDEQTLTEKQETVLKLAEQLSDEQLKDVIKYIEFIKQK